MAIRTIPNPRRDAQLKKANEQQRLAQLSKQHAINAAEIRHWQRLKKS